ncbi:hypothetical protein P5673_023226 [Acropora cervicornis]|uniref:GIY-YIG domain-containing protein n=1 Tax=Acropora cervicornis TaxID=6130 RepID=A0AAD9UZ26_ACRCE|nr:hypothetical protein P5673_023226 [Acropora cervicornis]
MEIIRDSTGLDRKECELLKEIFTRLRYPEPLIQNTIMFFVERKQAPLATSSHKIKDELKAKEPKPPFVNHQNVLYFSKCDLCDADYVGYTSRYLHRRVEEHKRAVIGKHVTELYGNEPCEIAKNFRARHELAFAKEVAQDSPEKPDEWEAVANKLCKAFSTDSYTVELKGRGCHEKMDWILTKYKEEDVKGLKR